MDLVEDKMFNKYIESYKVLPLKKKKDILVKEMYELIILLNKLPGSDNNFLFNKELIDLKKNNNTEDDYIECIYIYLQTIKNKVADYIMEKEGVNNGSN